MSYCRWSSDNWRCDLYCYESGDGFITHVANRKRIGEIPKLPNVSTTSYDEYAEAYKKHMNAVKKAKLVNIGLPYDSQTFNDPDLESFLKRIKHLKDVGYNVPDYVIEFIMEEIEDERNQPVTGNGEKRSI